jgi:addiction module HigA family antidote
MKPPHPGAFIREEILEPHGLNVSTGADVPGVRRATLSDLVNEKTSLSPEMALRIEKAFVQAARLSRSLLYETCPIDIRTKREHTDPQLLCPSQPCLKAF